MVMILVSRHIFARLTFPMKIISGLQIQNGRQQPLWKCADDQIAQQLLQIAARI